MWLLLKRASSPIQAYSRAFLWAGISVFSIRCIAVRALGFSALSVEIKGVILDGKAPLFGDRVLPLLDFRVVKFFNTAAVDTDQMVVVLAVIDFKNGLPGLKKVTFEQACLLELGEYAIHGRQADIHVFGNKHAINVFSRHVAKGAFLEKLKNFQARKSGFQAHILETLGVAHLSKLPKIGEAGQSGISGMIYRFKDV